MFILVLNYLCLHLHYFSSSGKRANLFQKIRDPCNKCIHQELNIHHYTRHDCEFTYLHEKTLYLWVKLNSWCRLLHDLGMQNRIVLLNMDHIILTCADGRSSIILEPQSPRGDWEERIKSQHGMRVCRRVQLVGTGTSSPSL